MTKLNNKGVSLIDCLIAVAVLALLVSPIIAQLFTTIQVSAEAKEKQYVMDDATDVYEYFRKYDNKELENDIARGNETGFKISNMIKWSDAGQSKGACQMYLIDGTAVSPTKDPEGDGKINFEWTKYELEDSDGFGRASNTYKRVVVRSDLRNKLYENGYQIDYSVANGSTTGLSSDFQFRSDNSIVKVSGSSKADLYDDSKITGIVVKKIPDVDTLVADPDGTTYLNKWMNDPNDIDIGNVQDIDADKMAIISGDATAIDYQLDLSLQNVLVQYATANPTSAIGTYANDPEGLNNYIKAVINNSSSTSKVRRIKVYVTCGKNSLGHNDLDGDGKPKFYTVKCDVTYRVTFSGSDLKAFNNFTSTTGEFTYPVLERNYYTTTPPDIYMIYEPLLLSTSMNSNVYYADNDYISIYTDEFTSAYNNNGTTDDTSDDKTIVGDDPSRMYLIRSVQNWAKVANTERGTNVATEANTTNFDKTAYYTFRYGRFVPVNIFINLERKDTDNSADVQPIDVYTNISSASLHIPNRDDLGEFNVINPDTLIGSRDSNNNTYPTPPSVSSGWIRTNYDPVRIIRVDKEKGTDSIDRLGQITVTYQMLDSNGNTDGEVTYITGAKGAD